MTEATRNLTIDRGGSNVWDRQSWLPTGAWDSERWTAVAGGSALVALGARRGGVGGAMIALAGLAVAARAALGRHDLRVARNWMDRTLRERGWRAEDVVEHASDESFPASDAPSWTPTEGTARRGQARGTGKGDRQGGQP